MNKKLKVIVIGNPIAGGGALTKIEKALDILKKRGCDIKLLLTARKGDAEDFAKKIRKEDEVKYNTSGSDQPGLLVIAAGGDGTYNEVANGLIYSNIPMAILPLGTTSVLAKELSLPEELDGAIEVALNGKANTVNLGKITLMSGMSNISRYFILMAGIGFDGETVFNVNEKYKRFSGKGAYILSGINTVLKYNPEELVIKGKGFSVQCYTAIIGKASCYGGKFKITPDATLAEPYFYIFTTQKKGRIDLLRYVFGILRGRHLSLNGIRYIKSQDVIIEGHAHIQIDGDYLGMSPAMIEIVPNAMKIIS